MRAHRSLLVGLLLLFVTPKARASETRSALPIKVYCGYTVVAQGSIGKLQQLNFIIDTGAFPAVVDTRIARELKLSGGHEQITVFSREVESERVVLPEFRLGPIYATAARAHVQDLSFAEKALGVRIDAIIGLDLLGHGGLSIDYRSKRLLFGQSELPNWVASFASGSPQVIVELHIDERPVRMLVDTGAKYLILFDQKGLGQFGGSAIRPQTEAQTISNFGGDVQLRPVHLADVSVGGMEFHDQPAYLTQADSGAEFDFDGVLGVAALNLQRIDFDFERGRVGWVR
jgi:predicted aspartyl protease